MLVVVLAFRGLGLGLGRAHWLGSAAAALRRACGAWSLAGGAVGAALAAESTRAQFTRSAGFSGTSSAASNAV